MSLSFSSGFLAVELLLFVFSFDTEYSGCWQHRF